MLPSILSAAMSLSLALTAAPPGAHKTSVTHAKYVTVSDGLTSKKIKLPNIHHWSKHDTSKAGAGKDGKAAASNGCFEVTANFGLVPCGSHPHR